MGLKQWVLWSAWYIKQLLFLLVPVLLTTLLIKVGHSQFYRLGWIKLKYRDGDCMKPTLIPLDPSLKPYYRVNDCKYHVSTFLCQLPSELNSLVKCIY